MAAAALIFLLLSGWLASAIYVARTARAQARENLRRAYSADMNLAMQAYETTNLTRLSEILARYENTDFKQNWEYRFLQNLINPKGKLLTISHPGEVWNITFSPDGKKMATGATDGFARIYEVPGGNLLAVTATQENNVWRIKFSPDGKFLATASGDSKSISAKIWDAETGAETLSLVGHTSRVRGIDFSPDGKSIATGSRDGTIRIWDAESGKELNKIVVEKDGEPVETNDLQFTPDGKKLIAGNGYGAKVWEISSGKILFNLSETQSALSVAASHDGKLFAFGGTISAIFIYDAVTGKPVSTINGHEAAVTQVVFSPDDNLIASASNDRTVRFFNVEGGAEIQNLKAHLSDAWSIAFSPDEKFIATSGTDFKAFLWDTTEVMKTSSFDFEVRLNSGWSPISADSTKAAVSYKVSENLVEQIIWDISAKKRIATFSNGTEIESRAFSPDGAILATGYRNGGIVFWNTASGAEIKRFKAHDNWVSGLTFSPDGRRLVSGGYDNAVKIWNTEDASLIRELCRFESRVSTLGISPDGNSDVNLLIGGDHNDTLNGGTTSSVMFGGGGGDVSNAVSGVNVHFGGSGSDKANGGSGTDVIFGDSDVDTLLGLGGNDVIFGGDGNDTLDGGAGNNVNFGNGGGDIINNTSGSNVVSFGNGGGDTIYAIAGRVVAFGNSEADTIYGGCGSESPRDFLFGNSGNDTLQGNAISLRDILIGGPGSNSKSFC